MFDSDDGSDVDTVGTTGGVVSRTVPSGFVKQQVNMNTNVVDINSTVHNDSSS
jgi:hypothetical protein